MPDGVARSDAVRRSRQAAGMSGAIPEAASHATLGIEVASEAVQGASGEPEEEVQGHATGYTLNPNP